MPLTQIDGEIIRDAGVQTIDIADSAITTPKILDLNVTTAKLKHYRLGTPSIFNNGIPYYRSGTSAGTYTIAYFPFPGSQTVGTPTDMTVVGVCESSGSSSQYIQIYDETHSLLVAQIDMHTYLTNSVVSTSSLNNIPESASVFSIRLVLNNSVRRIRVSSAVLEWN